MEQAKPADAPPQTQTIAIYARDAGEDLAQKIDIRYFVLPGGSLFDPSYTIYVSMKFPAGTDTRIVLANVVDENSCSVGQTGVLMLPDYMHPANPSPRPAVRRFALADGTAYFVVDPGKPAADFTVSCNLKDAAVNHTYTRRGANFEFTDFKSQMTSFLMPGFMDALNGYSPLAREAVNFGGIEGAEQFWFYGGYQDQRLASFESARVFAPGQQVYVTWSDVDREQDRDLLLVVIGILIGLGVTMFIEGLRPLIDALLEQKKRARHH